MSELTYEELDNYIGEISSGQKLVFVNNKFEIEMPLLFKHPTYRDKQLSTYIYRAALKEAERLELPAMEEMVDIIKERGLFSDEDEAQLEILEGRLKGQEAVLVKTTRVPARRDRLKANIADLQRQILDLKLKRERLFDFTRERKATEEKMLYLSWCGVYDPFSGELYWSTYDKFKEEEDWVFRKRVFVDYTMYYFGLDPKIVREIARSNLWRIRYVHALKTGESLFGRNQSDFTIDQTMLCYWSQVYQSVYEMLPSDRPPDSIVEDDAALDAYLKDYAAERSREDSAARGKKNKYGKPSAWDFQETLVMKSNEMYEDVEYSKTLREQGLDKGKSTQDAAPMGRGKKR